jgi:antitoxin (DNA-binding transcriptional repressor) of toxin-antitoxin stability system
MSTPAEDSAAMTAAIVATIGSPQSVTTDGVTVSSRPVADLIALDRYLASKAAVQTRRRGLRFNRMTPDGTVNRRCYRDSDAPYWRDV